MDTILIALANKSNAGLLSRALKDRYIIRDDTLDFMGHFYDLCIIDIPVLKLYSECLESAKLSLFPIPLPVVLIAGSQDIDHAIYLKYSFIDNIVHTPLSKTELEDSLKSLLRQRNLVRDLKSKKSQLLRQERNLRLQRESQVHALERMFDEMSQINQALLHLESREKIFDEVCRILVETGKVAFAWIGWLEPEGHQVIPVSSYGDDHGVLKPLQLAEDEPSPQWEATLRALKTNAPIIYEDLLRDNSPRATSHPDLSDCCCVCSLPLHFESSVCGALTIFGKEDGIFTPELVGLLTQVSANLDFALDTLARDQHRKQAEEKLNVAAARYRNILTATKDAFWLVSSSGSLLDVNEAAVAMSGYSREELLGKLVSEIDYPDSKHNVSERIRKTNELGWTLFESQHRTKDGRFVDVEVSTMPDADHDCVVAFIRDISERKQFESNLIEARLAAEAANEAKTRFLGHMSHELRTPMNAILGFAQILEHESLTADQLDMIGMIHEAGKNLLRIIEDILDLASIERGKLRLELESFDPVAQLLNIQHQLKPLSLKNNIAIIMNYPNVGLDAWLGYPKRLNQVLTNLVGNAIKFTTQGQVVIDMIPKGNGNANSITLRYEIKDTGIGISNDVLPNLFQPFTQADAGITRSFGGTGLGLAISKQLVELMGGVIGAKSQLGVGSTFWVEVPLYRVDPSQHVGLPISIEVQDNKRAQVTTDENLEFLGLHILVVDDNSINVCMIERALAVRGAEVTTASNGQQALDILRERPNHFNIVLMDIQMPVMDGLAATREIRSDTRISHLLVIALSAGVMPEERSAAMYAGVDDFLCKPIDLQCLKRVFERHSSPP